MAVPITLPVGTVLIYKIGQTVSPNGVRAEANFKFGTVYQIWAGGETFVYGGDTVLYNEKDQVCRLAWAGSFYTMIEYARLAGIDKLSQ